MEDRFVKVASRQEMLSHPWLCAAGRCSIPMNTPAAAAAGTYALMRVTA